MAKELSEEEIMLDDRDPLEAIAAIRREEGVPEEDIIVPDNDNSSEGSEPVTEEDGQDELDNLQDDNETGGDESAGDTSKGQVEDNSENAGEPTGDETEAGSDETADNESQEIAKRIFKANGQEFEFTQDEIMDQFEVVFGQAMNYTQKMQQIAPYRKMISALESEGVSSEQLNVAIDALKGNKQALQALLDANKIDPFDLTDEDEQKDPYRPTDYGKNEVQLGIEDVANAISKDPEYQITVDVIDRQWDQGSRQAFATNPQLIQGLHNDIKSGVYDKVAPAAMKMKVMDGNAKSDIEYYMLAGQQIAQEQQNVATQAASTVNQVNSQAQAAEDNFDQASSEASNKRAASPTRTRADANKGVVDYLDDNDEDFDAWYKKVMASQ